jgi:signal peptidase II
VTRAGTARRAAAVAAAVVAADQAAKAAVRSAIAPGATERVLPGVDLVNVRNSGVAFSLFAGGGAAVVVVSLVALGGLVAFVVAQGHRPLVWLPTGLVTGGAAGNLVDRAREGAVTDFVKLPHWPAFNLADAAITIGVVALVLVLERRPR